MEKKVQEANVPTVVKANTGFRNECACECDDDK